ncbi:hypothetical protein [Saccharopolyspora tripterygii]
MILVPALTFVVFSGLSAPLTTQIMPHATVHRGVAVVILARVELLDFLHYGLVTLVGLAAVATVWFAFYVVYRLYND